MKLKNVHRSNCAGCLFHGKPLAHCPRSNGTLICANGGIWEPSDDTPEDHAPPSYFMCIEYHDDDQCIKRSLTTISSFDINKVGLVHECRTVIKNLDPTVDIESKTLVVKLTAFSHIPHHRGEE